MQLHVLLLAASLTFAFDALAQPTPGKFPWDQRPNKCFLPGGEAVADTPMCKADDWPTFADTKRRVDMLMGNDEAFDLLERAEREVGFSRERFPTGEYRFEAWFLSMDTFYRAWGPRGKAIATAWAARSKEGYAPLAQTLAAHYEGRSVRGGGQANTVSPEQWAIYFQKLAEADAFLETASPKLREMAPWHLVKLRLAFESSGKTASPGDAFKRATDQWPDFLPIYTVAMFYSQPKWGGSWEEVDAVARRAMQKAPSGKAGMYTLVYERHLRVNRDGSYTLQDTKVDWKLMKQGFRELEDKMPWMTFGFAGLACQMRDRDEARRLYGVMEKRSPEAKPDPLDACRVFATSSP
jgi:hypothetical protein